MMGDRSILGGGDGSLINHLEEAQPSTPSSSFRKNKSRPRLIRRSIKTQNKPELNKNCNHPSTPYYSLIKIENLLNRDNNLEYVETNDDWYNNETDGDYFQECVNHDVADSLSDESIYARDEHQDSTKFFAEEALAPTMLALDEDDDACPADSGCSLAERVNQLLEDKGHNGSFPYRRPLGHVDEPLGIQLMSNSFTLSADDALVDSVDVEAPGVDAGTVDTPTVHVCLMGEGPAGDACELVADDVGPCVDESDDDDEDLSEEEAECPEEQNSNTFDCESSDDDDSESDEGNCEEEDEEAERKEEDGEAKENNDATLSAELSRSSENLRKMLGAKGMSPVMCAGTNALSLRHPTEMIDDDDSSDDDYDERDESVPNVAEAKTSTTTTPYSNMEHKVEAEDSDQNTTMSSVWRSVVEGAKYSSNLITNSISNSSLESSEDEMDDEDDEEENSVVKQTKGKLEIRQNEIAETNNQTRESPDRESSKNIKSTTSQSPPAPLVHYTLIKDKPAKNGAYNNLLRQNQLQKQQENKKIIALVPQQKVAPVLRPKQSLQMTQLQNKDETKEPIDIRQKPKVIKSETKPQVLNPEPCKVETPKKTNERSNNSDGNSRLNKKQSVPKPSARDRFTSQQFNNAKKNQKVSEAPSTSEVESTESTKASVSSTDKREERPRVNMAAVLSSKAKASLKKQKSVAKSEITLVDNKSEPKKTKSTFFDRSSYINHNREQHNKKQKDSSFLQEDSITSGTNSQFSRLEIPTEGHAKSPKESGSSVDPLEKEKAATPVPKPQPVSKAAELAKRQAMQARVQPWRPRVGATSKQLVRLNENANKPSNEPQSIEPALTQGVPIDLTTESNASNSPPEKERPRRKMMAFKTESSGGVARVYCVGHTVPQDDPKPLQTVQLFESEIAKIPSPTVIPPPQRAWYNPMRWLGSQPQHNQPVPVDNWEIQPNPITRRVPPRPPLPKPKPQSPLPDRRTIRHMKSNSRKQDVINMAKQKQEAIIAKKYVNNDFDSENSARNEAWKEDAERLKQERKNRLQLLKQEEKNKKAAKSVPQGSIGYGRGIPEKSLGYARGSRGKYKPQHVSNGSAVEDEDESLSEPAEPAEPPPRPKPKPMRFQRKQKQSQNTHIVDNSNGNNCQSEVLVNNNNNNNNNTNNNNNNTNNNNNNHNTNNNYTDYNSAIRVSNEHEHRSTEETATTAAVADANNSHDADNKQPAARLGDCHADGDVMAGKLQLLVE